MAYVGWVLVTVIALYWLAQVVASVLLVRGVPFLSRTAIPEGRADWPKLSMIVPACNEAATLEAALRSKLAEGYPNLEVVLIDDRSTDGTSELVDRLGALDPRLQAVHVTTLPGGWLGKLHALQRGLDRATGEWILFSDADIHFAPGALRRAIAHCEAHRLEHLSAFPTFWTKNVFYAAILTAFTRMFMLAGRPWKIADPDSKAGGGAGAFNLFTRKALDRTPGLEWLKLETADDVTLGRMLKRHGARSAFVNGAGDLALHFFSTLGELSGSVEKASTVFGFKIAPVIGFAALGLTLELGAFAFALLATGPLQLVAWGAVALSVIASVVVGRFFGASVPAALLSPLGAATMIAVMGRVGVRVARQGGLRWRGTLYPAEELLAGRRFGSM